MRIGDRLVSEGLITNEQLNEALSVQKSLPIRKKILVILTELGYIDKNRLLKFFVEQCRLGNLNLDSIIMDFPASEEEILRKLAVILNTDYYDLDSVEIDFKLASKVSLEVLRKYFAIPIKQNEFNVVVAFGDPLNLQAIEIIQRAFKQLPVKVAITKIDQVRKYIAKLELNEKVRDTVENIRKEVNQGLIDAKGSSSVLKLIEMIFKNAILSRASDIHIEPSQYNCIVRNRIDGILNESFVFDADIYPPLSSRLKLLANIDIAEKRKPQDGRISLKMFDKEYDFRVSSLPVMNGESIVLRILDKSKVMIKIEELGMNSVTFNRFIKATKAPYGMIFVTGPTGSGKTTTLYAALNAIKSTEKKIITVE
ncbi:MAG: Flp pilus assembly complex ATPase component TadA, partial [Campylobacterales bacterium]|nr:Flp pilus assembly complex ATPase component TadA [Campylobacterales bacterium]